MRRSNGDLATSVGAPTDSTDAGKKFLSEYQAAGYAEPAAAYGGYSYDAANAIIQALKTSLASATDVKSARNATIEAVGKVSFDGVTGKVAFDQYGDSTSKVLTVYKVDAGKWVAAKTDTVQVGDRRRRHREKLNDTGAGLPTSPPPWCPRVHNARGRVYAWAVVARRAGTGQ